jgi:hypothetical protein
MLDRVEAAPHSELGPTSVGGQLQIGCEWRDARVSGSLYCVPRRVIRATPEVVPALAIGAQRFLSGLRLTRSGMASLSQSCAKESRHDLLHPIDKAFAHEKVSLTAPRLPNGRRDRWPAQQVAVKRPRLGSR